MPIIDLEYERKQLVVALSDNSIDIERWRYVAKEFAYNLMGWMMRRGMSHADLASASGIYPATLTRIMRGNHNFRLDVVTRLAHVLDTDAYSLFRKPRFRHK